MTCSLLSAERQGFFLRCATKALRDNEPWDSHPVFSYKQTGRKSLTYSPLLAERQGFEPWVPVRVQRFSRPSRSTAPASFLGVLRVQSRGFDVSIRVQS